MPSISIIVPNFNHAQYLQRRLSSIFRQTIQDFELIFLDDASTDESLKVFESFAHDPRVICKLNDQNSGNPFIQWNKGLALAQGQYIWIAESDDFAEPTFLEEMIKAIELNPSTGLATCRSFLADDLDQNLGLFNVYHWFSDNSRWQTGYFNTGLSEIRDYLALQNTIPNASATLIRKSLIDEGARAPENMLLAGDWHFWVTLLLQTNICHIGKPLNYFRQAHSSSQRSRTASGGKEVFESFTVYEYILKNMDMDDRQKFRANWGLLRRWLSAAFKYKLSLNNHFQIYKWFLIAKFQFMSLKFFQLVSATFILILMPFTLLPGSKRLAMWVRNLLTDSEVGAKTILRKP